MTVEQVRVDENRPCPRIGDRKDNAAQRFSFTRGSDPNGIRTHFAHFAASRDSCGMLPLFSVLTALRVGGAIARIAQIYTVLLSEIAGKLPTAPRGRAPTGSRTLVNAAGLNWRLKSASQHVSFLGHLYHK
jgi:hypothetical protein